MKRLVLGSMVFCFFVGCASWQERLVPQAAFDLSCPEGQINVFLLNPHVAGVTGCGKKATYNDVCRGMYGSDCQWVLNNQSNGAPQILVPVVPGYAPAPPGYAPAPAQPAPPTTPPP
jgi:hypothetical protein